MRFRASTSPAVFYRTVRLAKVKHDVSIANLRPHEVLPPHRSSASTISTESRDSALLERPSSSLTRLGLTLPVKGKP
jgi:hypothetical protein